MEAGKWGKIAEKVNATIDGDDFNKDAVEKRYGVLVAGGKLNAEGTYIEHGKAEGEGKGESEGKGEGEGEGEDEGQEDTAEEAVEAFD